MENFAMGALGFLCVSGGVLLFALAYGAFRNPW